MSSTTRQNYGTPRALLDAVERRFGRVEWDLAANSENHVAEQWLGPGGEWRADALEETWRMLHGLLWLNPPFENITPWAWKCSIEAHYGARIALLTPASIGSEWFRKHVHGRALVLGLSPRLTFVGCADPYPRDCILSVFGEPPGFDVWRWDSGAPSLVAKKSAPKQSVLCWEDP